MFQRLGLIFRSPTLVLLCIIVWVAGARPQGRCEAELAKAEQQYNDGFFDQVIDVVKSCLNKGDITTAEQAWAYKLLGQAYISKNETHLARLCVQQLLEVAPDYEPDQDQDLQTWIELVEAAKQEREGKIQPQQLPTPPQEQLVVPAERPKKGSGKKWLWIGGGSAVVAGTAAYLIFTGEETRKRLPDPPGLPPHP